VIISKIIVYFFQGLYTGWFKSNSLF